MTDRDSDFDEFFHAHYVPLVRYLARQLGDRDAAEELAQETFVRALRTPPSVNQRAWLFTVATNLIRDHARKDARRRKQLEQLHDEQSASAREAIRNAKDPETEPTLLQQALASLNERDRAALLMSEEGLNYTQIAQALELSPQSVGTTLSRARRRLMERFETLTSIATGGNRVNS